MEFLMKEPELILDTVLIISRTIVPISIKYPFHIILTHIVLLVRGQSHMLNNGVLSFKAAINLRLLLMAYAFYVFNSHLHIIFCELISLVLG